MTDAKLYSRVIGAVLLFALVDARTLFQESTDPNDFSKPGPCSGAEKYNKDLDISVAGTSSSYSVQITLPTNCPADGSIQPPFPVLFFFNGFQSRASFYEKIILKAVSWGYACVQYDMRMFSITTIKAEMDAFPELLAYLEKESAADSQTPLAGKLDLSRSVISGHSRGGKLAALLFADPQYQNFFKATWLIDPIDETKFAPLSEDYPSAYKAIADSGKLVGITGAGVISSCNEEGNYESLWYRAAPGSWLAVIPNASHSQFADGGIAINTVQDLLCGKGSDSRDEIVELTSTPMLAWFHEQLKTIKTAEIDGVMANFWGWVIKEEGLGNLIFSEKPTAENTIIEAVAQQPQQETAVGSRRR